MLGLLPPPAACGAPDRFPAWRPAQEQAVLAAIDAPTRYVGLVLPTGAGKSLIYMVAALLSGKRTAFLTFTKGLQAQLSRDFESSGLIEIKGMNAYPCQALKPGSYWTGDRQGYCDEGPCLEGNHCAYRDGGCHYFDALLAAQRGKLVCANYAYWLSSYTYGQGLGEFDWLVLDEAPDVPEALASFLAQTLTAKEVGAAIGTKLPVGEQYTAVQWAEWADVWGRRIEERLENLRPAGTPGEARERRRLRRLGGSLEILSTIGEESEQGQWIIHETSEAAKFDPLWPGRWAERYLFRGIKRIILTSATLRPKTLDYLGIPYANVTWLETPSFFPVERRPIYVFNTDPKVRVDHKWSSITETLWHGRIQQIIAPRLDRKGIIHTVSYKRRDQVLEQSEYADYMISHGSDNTRAAVEGFKALAPPAILVSPSMATGWDFPGDQCEYQIVGKIPFPDSRDPVVAARTALDPDYPAYLAMQILVQQAGRGMRSAFDQCETFVIDDHVGWFLKKYALFAPMWFRDAIRRIRTLPGPPPPLNQKE